MKMLEFTYTNYRGETALRAAQPHHIWFGTSPYHGDEPDWYLRAVDVTKGEERDFRLLDCVFEKGSGALGLEQELICMLAEEAAEVAQAAMKWVRHGPNSFNPDDAAKGDNRTQLENELIDLDVIRRMLTDTGALRVERIVNDDNRRSTFHRKLKYMHNALPEEVVGRRG